MPRELKEQSIRECALIMVLRHPNVIACYDAFLENGELHMILELAGGYVHFPVFLVLFPTKFDIYRDHCDYLTHMHVSWLPDQLQRLE